MTVLFRESLGRLAAALRGAGHARALDSGAMARAFGAAVASKTKKKVPASAAAGTPKPTSPRGGASSGKKVAEVIKPAPSAYMLFLKHEFGNLRKAQPNISFVDASRRIADMWKHVPAIDKSRFITESAKLRDAVAAKKTKAKGPKRPPSAYMAYMQEIYPQMKARYPDEKIMDLGRRVGEMWRKMGTAEKEQRKKKAKQAQLEFDMKLAKRK